MLEITSAHCCSQEEELERAWEVQDQSAFPKATQGGMGADICAKETTRDSDGCSMAKGDIHGLGEDHCSSSAGQKRSCFMSTAAAQEEGAEG